MTRGNIHFSIKSWIAVLIGGCTLLCGQNIAAAVEIFVPNPNNTAEIIKLQDAPVQPANPLPVLFVHGHNVDDPDDGGNLAAPGAGTPGFKTNWVNPLNGQQSFHNTIYSSLNNQLGIEPYYIRFRDQHRSIATDAAEIGAAVTQILQRHDPNYNPSLPESTHVKVAIIGFSKGTISTRYYLKELNQQNPNFKPVSEFIAIAPPNHGLDVPYPLLASQPELPNRELNNGYNGRGLITGRCLAFNDQAQQGFMADLNGHNMSDSHADAVDANGELPQIYPSEAPGSRDSGQSPQQGILYVALYAAGNADLVGGHHPPGSPNNPGQSDCAVINVNDPPKQGRVVAKNLAPHAKNIQISGIPGGSSSSLVHQNSVHFPEVMCQALYTVMHHRTPPAAGAACAVINGIPQVPLPPRASVELVLDRSGSMNWPACPTCADRIEILKIAVDLFIDLWKIVGAPSDQLGVTYFSTDASEFACNDSVTPECRVIDVSQATVNDQGLLSLLEKAGDIKQNVNDQLATGATAMGKGLKNAIQRLQTQPLQTNDEKRIILFTDGMQNVSPLVATVPAGCTQTTCQYEIATSPPIHLNQTLDIPIDTIGIGSGDPFLGLLNAVAANTGGYTNTTLDPQNDLKLFFIESLINALRGFSPQLIDFRRNIMNNDEVTESFTVNRGVSKVILNVSWPRGSRVAFSVEKDGTDMTSAGQIVDHDAYRIIAIDFPTVFNGQPLDPAGEWTLRIRGASGTPYQAAAIVDQASLQYTTSIGTKPYVIGEKLNLEVDLMVDGQPLTTPAQVRATLQKPGKSLGTLLATNPVRGNPSGKTLEPQNTAGQTKFQLLTLNENISKQLQPKADTVTLEQQGGGKFSAQTPPATVPGIYNITFDIQGDHPALGPFQRRETRSTHVSLAKADLQVSDVTVESSKIPTGRQVTLTIRPQDILGNYLGPDYGSRVQIIPAISGYTDKPVQDHGDGRYSLAFPVPDDTDPQVIINILGTRFFDGNLSVLDTAPKGPSLAIFIILILILIFIFLIVRFVKKL